jgi:hypothetical protein
VVKIYLTRFYVFFHPSFNSDNLIKEDKKVAIEDAKLPSDKRKTG